jgi:hypothetical protein
VHHTCLAQILDIPVDELTKDIVLAALNPLKLEEWTYICKPCKLQADSSSGYVKKNVLKQQMKNTNQASSASTTPDDPGPVPPLEVIGEQTPGDASPTELPTASAPLVVEVNDSTITNEDVVDLAVDTAVSQSASPAADDSNICQDYLTLSCYYGRSGNGCPSRHPELCSKVMQHGDSGPDGCDGIGCSLLHPRMCNSSLKKRTCFYKN